MNLLLTVAALPLWFFADFDSQPQLDGAALTLPMRGESVEGRFGKGAAFMSDLKRCENAFLVVRDRELLKNFPSERGSFACWHRTPETFTNLVAEAPAFGLTGFWQFQWQWTGGGFRASAKRGATVKIKGFARSTQWHHFAATWNPERIAVYIDGRETAVREKPMIDPFAAITNAVFRIGTSGDGSGAANLVMDEIAIFRKDLSAAEVAELAAAKKGLMEGRRGLLAAPLVYPLFWRNASDSAIRLRVFTEEETDCEATAEVGGRALKPFAFKAVKGESLLEAPFEAWRYRAGKYPWKVTLRSGGRTVLERGGELQIFPRVDRDQFKFLSWGGYRHISEDYMRKVGINSSNSRVGDSAGVRRLAAAGIFPNMFYGNVGRWKRGDIDPEAIQKETEKDFIDLKGLHLWKTTLINTEVYGSGYMRSATNHPAYMAWAERELGFKPDCGYGNAPSSVNAKTCEGGMPTGVVKRGSCRQLDTLGWELKRGMLPYLIGSETAKAIHSIDADNEVWSEPNFEGVADRLDMMANWHYQYRTVPTVRELYGSYATARAYGKPYMPTLSGTYFHGNCIPVRRDAKRQRNVSGNQSADEVAIKAWISIGAVPAHALSFFMLDGWTEGAKNSTADADAGDRFGAEWHSRIKQAAALLRDMPNERAPVAYVLPSECSFTFGCGWGETHYRDHLADAIASVPVPFDVIRDRELEAGALKGYRYAILPMGKAIYEDHVARLDEAAESGVKIVTDAYCCRDFKGGVRLSELDYYYHPKRWHTIGPRFLKWYSTVAPGLREGLTARSDGDCTNAFTFVKKYGGATYVTVVNDRRRETPGFLNTQVTNSWCRPYGERQTITTRFNLPAPAALYEFNAPEGRSGCRKIDGRGETTRDFAAAEGVVYCLYPKELGDLDVEAEGDSVVVTLLDEDGDHAPGRQVVEVEVRDPDGALHDETGLYAMERGRLEIKMLLADDEPSGSFFSRWKIKVKELTTGKVATCKWRKK
ncbi:MAG: LamG domain-containing protein [Kiritimatiellae bacterium]|nr:LamG domain-containing protein [Kiritimatiellia bacterium]